MSRVEYVSVSFAGLFALALTATLIGPSFPLIKTEFGVSLELLGFLASAWSAGYLLSLVGGFLSDRYGELVIISLSLAMVGLAAASISVVRSYDLLLVLFLMGGIGAAFGEAGMNPLVSKLFAKRSGFALNVLHLFYSLGAFVGPVLAGLIITWYGSWRLSYLIVAVFFGPLIVASVLMTRRVRRENLREASLMESGKGVSVSDIVKHGRALMLAGFFYLSAETGTNAWLPTFLVLVRGFSIESAGFSLGLFWGAMAAGRLILGSVTDKVHFRRMILLCSVLSAALILIGLSLANQFLIIILWSLSGFAMGPVMPTIFAWTSRLFPQRSGFATGLIYGVGFAGGVFTPWLLGVLADLISLEQAIFCLAVSALAIGVSILAIND